MQGMSTEDLEKTRLNATSSKDTGAPEQKSSVGEELREDSPSESQNGPLPREKEGQTVPVNSRGSKDITDSLLPKLLRTTKMLLASRNFFFSYDYDITRRFGSLKDYSKDTPMCRVVDPLVCFLLTLRPVIMLTFPTVFLEPSLSDTIC